MSKGASCREAPLLERQCPTPCCYFLPLGSWNHMLCSLERQKYTDKIFQGHLRVFHSLHTLFNAFLGLKLLDFQVIRIPLSYSLLYQVMNLQLKQGLVLLVTVTLYVPFDHPFMCLSNSGLQEALRQSRLWKGLQCVAGVAQGDRYPFIHTFITL